MIFLMDAFQKIVQLPKSVCLSSVAMSKVFIAHFHLGAPGTTSNERKLTENTACKSMIWQMLLWVKACMAWVPSWKGEWLSSVLSCPLFVYN